MFQRRCLIVARRMQNAHLTAPNLSRPKRNEEERGGADHDTEGEEGGASGGDIDRRPGRNNNNLPRASSDEEVDTDALFRSLTSIALKNETVEAETISMTSRLRISMTYLSFFLYLFFGTLYYMYDPGNELDGMLAFYEAITTGFSVGLSPKDPDYVPDPWFSSIYILFGSSLIAVLLTKLGQKIEDSAAMNLYQSLKRRETYEKLMDKDNPLMSRCAAFLKFNAAYLIVILVWILFLAFIVAWSMLAVTDYNESTPWDFAHAQYFAVSLSSSAGSFSLPPNAPQYAYGLAALSMMLGVPLMAMGISSIVIMLWQGQRFKKVKEAAWEPVTRDELRVLNQLGLRIGAIRECCGISKEDDDISKGAFILLGLLRMGQDVGMIKYLADAYEASEERGGVLLSSEQGGRGASSTTGVNDYYSSQARAYVGWKEEDEEGERRDVTKQQRSNAGDGKTFELSWSVAAADSSTRQIGELGNFISSSSKEKGSDSMRAINEKPS